MKFAGFRALLVLVGIHLAVGSGACAAGPDRRPDLRAIQGVVRIVGNEPFTHVVVTSAGDAAGDTGRIDYEIAGPLAAELRARYQGRVVTLEGRDAPPSRPWFRYGFAPTRILGSEGSR